MNTILDNQETIKKVDISDMLGDLFKTSDYCRDAIKRAEQVNLSKEENPRNIVIVGMGGSAIGGEILKDWLRNTLPIPIEVCRDYILPAYVNKNTLVLVNSYSGNTEETLSAFLNAIKRKCRVLAVTSDGQLKSFCKKLKVHHVIIPSGLQPRVAVPYLFFPLPVLLEKLGILSDIDAELEEAINVLEKVAKTNTPNIPLKDNRAKQLATEILGTIPVVYGFRQYTCIAHRLKAQFNENSKIHSRSNVFPELNHNETVGYDAPESLNKNHSVILIRDPQEPPEIRNRIETTADLVFDNANKVMEIEAHGEGKLAKMLSVMCIGDYTSVYLAIIQKKDPTPVKIIDRVKSELAKKTRMKEQFEDELTRLK
jgi:glucose/mannose-6-phosphate isomerase